MTISSTLLALVLMPLCLWIYSRAWINTPLVQLLPLGAVTLTLCSTLIPIGLGVFIRYRYSRVADYIVKVRPLSFPGPTRRRAWSEPWLQCWDAWKGVRKEGIWQSLHGYT